jgi:hypothetical protein
MAPNSGYSSASMHMSSSESQSYITTNGQLASLSWCQAPIWRPRLDFYYCQTVAGLLMWGHPLWWEDGSVVCNCCWSSPLPSFLGPSPTELMTIFYCLRFETPPTWRAKSPYLYPPGTAWPSYILRLLVPFLSPPMTRRAMVEVFEPASSPAVTIEFRHRPHRKHRFQEFLHGWLMC